MINKDKNKNKKRSFSNWSKYKRLSLAKINSTIKQQPNNKPFKPSIKFDPFIKIIKQKLQKIISKTLNSINLSNKLILVDKIWISKK